MSWLVSNWDVVAGIVGAAFGLYQKTRASKAKRVAARTAAELNELRNLAGTKASWEKP